MPKFLSVAVCVRVGDVVPLTPEAGEESPPRATVLGRLGDKVIARLGNGPELVEVTGVRLEEEEE